MNAEVLAEKLANEHRPKFFKDFISNSKDDCGSPASVLKDTIKKNYHSVLGNIALLGPSGCGKSSLSKLHSKATLCYNRLEEDYEPCGECQVCLGEDTSNIAEYTIHNPTAAWEPIRELIQLSRQAPVINREGIRADQYYRFIILNEIQQASPELLALLYDAMEYAPATTIWILISMDEDKLRKKSEQTAEAIIGRCADLHLPSFSDSAMASNIVGKTDINYDAAMAIAKLSNGNMRRVWNNVAIYRALVDEDSEISEDLVLYSRSGGATKENRLTMWQALAKGDGRTVKDIIDNWTEKAADIKLVGNLLQIDIIDNLHSSSPEVQSLLASLGRWYTGISYPLTTVFMSHLGTKVIQFPYAAERELKKQIKEEVVPKLTVADQVAQQLVKGVSNTFKVPVLVAVSSYKELMLYYDRD
jgi:DNA polymerase III gamma/tau subunit